MYRLALIIILSVVFCGVTVAKSKHNYFNTEEFWNRLVVEHQINKKEVAASDTVLAVVSSRLRNADDDLRFMSEEHGGDSLYYYFVYAHNGKWHLIPTHSLAETIALTPNINKDWVMYTEGMGKIFTSNLDRGMNMAAQYDVNVLLLDYPSYNTSKGIFSNYFFSLKNAKHTYLDFFRIIEQVKEMKIGGALGTGKLSMFYHSMGNNMIREIVKHHKLKSLNDKVWVDNIILNAACVPQRNHADWINKINFTKHTYIHYNPHDRTLSGAHLLSKKRELGERVRNPISTRARYINFSQLVDQGHSNFLSLHGRPKATPEAIAHYRTVLHGDTINFNGNEMYQPTDYRDIGWDILPTEHQDSL